MSGPEDRQKEDLAQRMENIVKIRLAELVPEIEALPPESVDEELILEFDKALKLAKTRMSIAKSNGKPNGKGDCHE